MLIKLKQVAIDLKRYSYCFPNLGKYFIIPGIDACLGTVSFAGCDTFIDFCFMISNDITLYILSFTSEMLVSFFFFIIDNHKHR